MKIKGILPIFALAISSLAVFTAVLPEKEEKVEAYANNDTDTYYSGISTTATGDTLLNALKSLNGSKRRTLVDYYKMQNYFEQTDPYPGGGMISYYDGKRIYQSGMNREHVWPFSRLKQTTDESQRGNYNIEKDMQMVRPIGSAINEARGNKYFNTYEDDYYWDPGAHGEETFRGDAARIIFYCMVADNEGLGLKLTESSTGSMQHAMGSLSALLEWNIRYPSTSREKTRNEAVESIQGHRNPFIDNPGYACRIWGNTNDLTKAICCKDPYNNPNIVDATGITIDESFVLLRKDETKQVTASVLPSNASDQYVTWSTSDSLVANATNGLIKPVLNEGSCTITATSHDGGFKASVGVVVSDNPIRATSISFPNKNVSMTYGESKNIQPTFTPSNTTYKGCEYIYGTPGIVSVNTEGKVTTLGVGTTTIAAKSLDGNFTDTMTLTVNPGAATGVTFKQSEYTIRVGQTKQIEVIFTPEGSTTPLTWSSSSPDVVSVDQNGIVKGLKEGLAFIFVKYGNGKTISTSVTVFNSAGCRGNIATTSIVISLLALSGLSLLLFIPKKRKE